MRRRGRIRVRVGDIFVVPMSEGLPVYGQVIAQSGTQFLVVLFRKSGSIDEAITSGIELAGVVFDAKWRNGDWPIVENRPPAAVKTPWFVVGHLDLGNVRLTNFDGTIERPATAAEASRHRNRAVAYPMALQMAAEAAHGVRRWSSEFDRFRELGAELASG